MSKVNKNITVEAKLISPPTYIAILFPHVFILSPLAFLLKNCSNRKRLPVCLFTSHNSRTTALIFTRFHIGNVTENYLGVLI